MDTSNHRLPNLYRLGQSHQIPWFPFPGAHHLPLSFFQLIILSWPEIDTKLESHGNIGNNKDNEQKLSGSPLQGTDESQVIPSHYITYIKSLAELFRTLAPAALLDEEGGQLIVGSPVASNNRFIGHIQDFQIIGRPFSSR